MNDSTFKMEASEEVKVQLVDVMGQGRFRNFSQNRDFDNKNEQLDSHAVGGRYFLLYRYGRRPALLLFIMLF